jgi:c-di-GMP-specific phosphodiesterase
MGLMGELGAMMMRTAAAQLATWRINHRASGELTVAVNLSTGEIDRPDLISDVTAIRRETGLPPGALKLEVTEGDVMRDPDRAAVILRELRSAGAALALDDFGTGFSSLSYLTRLPFDTLKIDRYFVRTMATNEGSATIVSSVVKLGQDLALEVVAEGVENAGMARQLLALGYAGWGAGQLENEIKENVWLTCEADEGLIFGDDYESKWTRALAKLGVDPQFLGSAAGRA